MSCHWIFYRNYSILHLGAGLPFSYLPYIDFGGFFFSLFVLFFLFLLLPC